MTKFFKTNDYMMECSYNPNAKKKQLKIKDIVLMRNTGEIVLPENIDGMPVTGIKLRQKNKSKDSYTCEMLVLPSTLKVLDKKAFKYANSFDGLYIPKAMSPLMSVNMSKT